MTKPCPDIATDFVDGNLSLIAEQSLADELTVEYIMREVDKMSASEPIVCKALPPLPTNSEILSSNSSIGSNPINSLRKKSDSDSISSSVVSSDRGAPGRQSSLADSSTQLELRSLAGNASPFVSVPSPTKDVSAVVAQVPTRIRKQSTMGSEEQARLQMINAGKKKFNLSAKLGLQYLCENKYFSSSSPSAPEIAGFLFRENEMLSKSVLGEYLGDGSAFNIKVLHHFVGNHDFHELPFDDALRRFLKSFRLPGEAQKIDRMMERFAERYIECNPAHLVFRTVDSAYIMAFSVIMLNTDLHNASVKNKMKKQTFIRNNLDVVWKDSEDEGHIYDAVDRSKPAIEYLSFLYESIKKEALEFVDPDNDDPLNDNPFVFTFANPEREGWLIKQGGRIKTWKKRYCILTGSCIYYFKTDSGHGDLLEDKLSRKKQQPCGIIPLENLSVEPLDIADGSSSKKKFFFRLHICVDENVNYPQCLESPTSPTPISPTSGYLYKRFKNTIKAAKTSSDGKVVEGRHSDYLFMCECEDQRDDWIESIKAQMSKPPIYELYERRKNKINGESFDRNDEDETSSVEEDR